LRFGHLDKDVVSDLVEYVVGLAAGAALGPALSQEDVVAQQLRLLQLLRDVDVVVHPEHLGQLRRWQRLPQTNTISQPGGPNLQNFVRRIYENVTKKSDIRKVS